MKKSKKKGFSLMELLAVIVILAILALITIPIIGNLLKQARINAAVVSAYGYVEATNNEVVSKQTKGENVLETTYNIVDFNITDGNINVKYEGRGPEKGWFNISRVKVSEGVFCINGYEIKYENGKAVYDPEGGYCSAPPTATICRLKDEVKKEAESNGTYTSKYSETTDFFVETADDMYCLAEIVNGSNGVPSSNFSGKKITMSNSLNMSNKSSFLSESEYYDKSTNTPVAFNPIGNSSKTFNGTFDGNGKTISNLTINKSSSDNIGLFGYAASGSKILGITLENASITGRGYVGGVVGYLNSGTVRGININNSTITGASSGNYYYVGGAIGYINYGSQVINEIAVNDSSVKGSYSVGGVIGYINRGTGSQSSLYSANNTITSNYYAGGLVGEFDGYDRNGAYTYIYGAVYGGNITASSYAGRACGYCRDYKGVIYASSDISLSGSSNGGNGTSYNKEKDYIAMYDDVIDTYIGGDNNGSGYFLDFESNTSNKIIVKKVDEHSFDTSISGEGTEESPYILSTEKDFKDATLLLKGSYYFKLNNDVDISSFNHFYALGTASNYFNGKLLGDNKTISNIDMNGGNYTGFIGYANGARIQDLKLSNSALVNRYGGQGTGALIGRDVSTTILNVELNGVNVTANQYVGGLVGYVSNGTTRGINVYNSTISGATSGNYYYVGGAIGYVDVGSPVLNEIAVNDSTIKGSYSVGGVIGYINRGTGTQSSLFSGNNTVTGTYYSGGLVGEFDGYDRNNQYTYVYGAVLGGNITASNYAGRACGYCRDYKGLIYASTDITVSGSTNGGYGNGYNPNHFYMAMFDDVIDTYIGGDNNTSGYYLDYESDSSNKIIVKKVNEHSFDTTISGEGTEADPYILSTEKDFKDATLLLKGQYYFKLNNDVDISSFTHFYALGTTNNYFNGKLLGNDKTISNMNLNGGNYAGFIGYANGARVQDLNIENSVIANRYGGEGGTGILVGRGLSSQISNISIDTITVSGSNRIGSIVGYSSGTTVIGINMDDITISGSNYAGGVIGYDETSSILKQVYGDGINVTTSTDYAGGVIGYQNGLLESFQIENVVVSGHNYSGGVIGYLSQGTTREGIVRGSVTGTYYVGGVVGCTNSPESKKSGVSGVLVNADVTGTNIVGIFLGNEGNYSVNSGVVEGGSLSAPNGLAGKACGGYNQCNRSTIYTASNLTVSRNRSEEHGYRYDYYAGDGYNYNVNYHSIGMYDDVLDTFYGGDNNSTGYYLDYENDNSDKIVLKKVNDHSFDTTISGSGTEGDPYILSTEKDFKDAAVLLGGSYYFKLNNNMDASTFRHLFQLGTTSNYFNGILLGNNKVISNLYLNGGRFAGFIGYGNGATIQDLTFNNSILYTTYGIRDNRDNGRVGLVIGNAINSNINRININTATVSGNMYVGGIAGYTETNTNVRGLFVDGISVTGSSTYIGGVIGYQNGLLQSFDVENATVRGSNYVGGAIGYLSQGTTREGVVRGSVTGTNYVGGVVGCANSPETKKSGASGVLVNADVTGTNIVGIFLGDEGNYSVNSGVVEGGSLTAPDGLAGKACGGYSHCGRSTIYTASNLNVSRNRSEEHGYRYDYYASDGFNYNVNYHSIGMYDDVLDTFYGGDNNSTGYYLDYENDNSDKIVLKKVNDNSFDTTISGSGTEANPYILSTEKNFKDAAVLLGGNYYFKLSNNIDASTFRHLFQLGTTSNPFKGVFLGNNKVISNLYLNGGKYAGLFANTNGSTIKEFTINTGSLYSRYGIGDGKEDGRVGMVVGNSIGTAVSDININNGTVNGKMYVGGVVGYQDANSSIRDINIRTISVTGASHYIGGIVGDSRGQLLYSNVINGTVTGLNNVGGLVGYLYNTIVKECTARGTVTGDIYVGGAVGNVSGGSSDLTVVSNVLTNSNVTGQKYIGGVVGQISNGYYIYSLYEGGSVTTTGTGDENGIGGYIAGGRSQARGLSYRSSGATISRNKAIIYGYRYTDYSTDGNVYNADEGSLQFYKNLTYTLSNVTYPLLDSKYSGDINNTGHWFDLDSDGLIIITKIGGSSTPQPDPDPTCTNCPEIENFNSIAGTCPEGDVTPPVCTFYSFGAVSNGIQAYFSCTDETSVPTIVSMFNATTKEAYTAQDILDRGGSTKTGSVSGNTRTVRSTWTTTNQPQNPPQEGLCYYYQFTAKDACGNESDWVTKYCGTGFSN